MRATLSSGWPTLLRRLEFVAYPAAAGAAFTLLSLGVVTWLPALAAMGHALQRWREEGDSRCFANALSAFPRYWRALWRHGLLSTVVAAVLAANITYLLGRSEPWTFVVLAAQAGIAAAFVIHHVALAAEAGRAPDGSVRSWSPGALALGFGSAARGTALLGAVVSAVLLSLVVPLGPLLLGPSIPVLLALSFADPRRHTP
ncbi:YesL family protein [Streptomyces sp. NPDC048560]|uniref:YesL family protein n=1 Tax=Streptomyces sp. NPDC048560 TaxID=3155488 RepID=UPI00343F67B9